MLSYFETITTRKKLFLGKHVFKATFQVSSPKLYVISNSFYQKKVSSQVSGEVAPPALYDKVNIASIDYSIS